RNARHKQNYHKSFPENVPETAGNDGKPVYATLTHVFALGNKRRKPKSKIGVPCRIHKQCNYRCGNDGPPSESQHKDEAEPRTADKYQQIQRQSQQHLTENETATFAEFFHHKPCEGTFRVGRHEFRNLKTYRNVGKGNEHAVQNYKYYAGD